MVHLAQIPHGLAEDISFSRLAITRRVSRSSELLFDALVGDLIHGHTTLTARKAMFSMVGRGLRCRLPGRRGCVAAAHDPDHGGDAQGFRLGVAVVMVTAARAPGNRDTVLVRARTTSPAQLRSPLRRCPPDNNRLLQVDCGTGGIDAAAIRRMMEPNGNGVADRHLCAGGIGGINQCFAHNFSFHDIKIGGAIAPPLHQASRAGLISDVAGVAAGIAAAKEGLAPAL